MHIDVMSFFAVFFASAITQNIVLVNFLGLCPFVPVSKEIPASLILGAAVTFFLVVSMAIGMPVSQLILVPYHLEYLRLLAYITIIALLIQIAGGVTRHVIPLPDAALGEFVSLVTVNCAILGVLLFATMRSYSTAHALVYAAGSGTGYTLVITAMAGIRRKLQFSNIPKGLQGPGITMIVLGIMALAFMGFFGIVNP
jgi:Na+-transporting NADH:ubiquinone oxidoreductase subunit E